MDVLARLSVVFILCSLFRKGLSDSCIGRCGQGVNTAYNCQCNSACVRYNDCCADYDALCLGGQATVDVLSAVMQDLWNSDTNRLRESDYTISTTGSRLFTYVNTTALNKPTFQGLIHLLDNYNIVVGQAEQQTTAELAEVNDFVNTILATSVMTKTFTFLVENGHITNSNSVFRDVLMELWFNLYPRSNGGPTDSSGFEHVIVGELKGTSTVSGFHSWIRLYLEEKNGNLLHESFLIRKEPNMIATAFSWHGVKKTKASFFLGTSPEFDMAVYTICGLVHRDSLCKFTLQNQAVSIQTWDVVHKSGYQVASAYPSI
ncbi:hypothetical protein CHS0354_003273 [Potamilus streckersoni]|uniref:Uridylate-specific endoribonuclease n=1 Tax=Potamilus streckersoni TaxID=2493646 RepID=A0AAE0W344_9BIVA|nr:hypothetical protein CHS0354_003273 [Potamilus streckersoni]